MRATIIDCDPGIDDALALLLAAGSPELDLLAVTTVAGNRPAPVTARNARQILDLAGRPQVPVHAGAERPLAGGAPRCNLVHGEDGLGGVDLGQPGAIAAGHAAIALVDMLRQHSPASIDLVAMGPLTNLALAELLSPGVLQRAGRLAIMGGALRVPGNIRPAAEFNFYADALAADIVLRSGAAISLFALDVTHQAIMSPPWIASFAGLDSRSGNAAAAMLQAYAAMDPLLHDVCPVAYLLRPQLFDMQPCRVQVDVRAGTSEGYVLAHFDVAAGAGPMVQAATGVDNPALLALVFERIARLP
ncbi:nucleoside hydrolase [Herbaspirillum sp. alder98]|uniref:nucleoside hydrolase n=1 Tax=Herbaspirillum sp. alder98 TaxID=2913096 RepID=UPI001CD88AE7|nr:nucleoside hydrolase [Herbaspirillum sp. alder98]MCA1325595.1 nucleoside hydrolase [Herbaspirillum sp. alder98]